MQIEVTLPKLSDDVADAEVIKLMVAEGDAVQVDQIVAEVGSDKATADIQSPKAGRIAKISVSPGQTIPVGAVILTVEVEEHAAPPQPASEAAEPAPAPVPTPTPATPSTAATPPAAAHAASTPAPPVIAAVAAGPAVRRFAREVGVDLSHVAGSGPGGRITREDVLKIVRSASPNRTPNDDSTCDAFGPVQIEPLSKIRRTIAERMHTSWSTVPRVTNYDDADVTELERIRQASKADYAEKGIKLTAMPFLIKAVAMSLREHPTINASLDLDQGEVIYKSYVNLGIAVDTENGLVVPVIRNADETSISEIARDLSNIAQRVRDRKFTLDDLKGSTFTISNLGAIGGTYSTPIVNVPEVAILLVGRSRKMPIVVGDAVKIRLMMPLSLSYDHRLVDGAAAARFLNEVKSCLEAPSRLLLAP